MTPYVPRHVDTQLKHALTIAGAVNVQGPRACGKTESARQQSASEQQLDLIGRETELAKEDPRSALRGDKPRLLDEWQAVPGVWNAVRHEVDRIGEPGQFLLTGSASPDDDPTRHSGAGRFIDVRMRTMTLTETGHSTGKVSLTDLLQGKGINSYEDAETELLDVVTRIVTGGWPGWFNFDPEDAQDRAHEWIDSIVMRDYPSLAGRRRNPQLLRELIHAIAPLVSQPASYRAIKARIEGEASAMADSTVAELYDFARQMYVVEDQPAWSPKLRSKQTAAQTPVRHLADPSLAAAVFNVSPGRLLDDLETLGFLFESQVVHDVRAYAQAAKARGVYHYRDTKGRDEIDVVVESRDGNWVGIEVKVGWYRSDEAALNLLRVAKKIQKQPTALVVVTATGTAHTRKDGVHVVPIGVLGP